ncbi:MAG: AmmeMemoRadiSam system protein B [Planctomycetaceae bacterium]
MSCGPQIRRPAVAGQFYPADPVELRLTIDSFLAQAVPQGRNPKALIVPHAGYVYSGPVAASAYGQLLSLHGRIQRVVLLGPTHHVRFQGLAASSADVYASPLGGIPLDRPAVERALELSCVRTLDNAHLREHSLEVHLPFLQVVLGQFQLVPLVVGQTSAMDTADVLERLWGGPETLIVISSDLSHFHDWATARRLDAETCRVIEARRSDLLTGERACGCHAVNGLLKVATRRQLPITTLDLRNSGDIVGQRDRVVGYGAWLVG